MQLQRSEISIGKAMFILSLDTELAWGSFDKGGLDRHGASYGRVREVAGSLLALCERYAISATWATVGHLFLESCSREGADAHNDVLQPEYGWYGKSWLSHDPYSNVREAPSFYAPDLIEGIRACRQPQEIASHTFTHAILGDPECTPAVALSQLEATQRVARRSGVELRSLVFPRNRVGHLDAVCQAGLRAFRGPTRYWFRALPPQWALARACHWADLALAVAPPVYARLERWRPNADSPWLWDLPASMFYAPLSGVWRCVPVAQRVRKVRLGLRRAARRRALFHLWLHPFNLATSPRLLDGMERIFATAAAEREAGRLMTCSMSQAVDYLDALAQKEDA